MALRYVSHPEVQIDAAVPVPEWCLSAVGRTRAAAAAVAPWMTSVGRIVTSPEAKAVETATILATTRRLDVEVRDGTGEIDRSSTGYVPHARHEALADACFARPERSADGWERAIDAQRRVVDALADLFEEARTTDLVVVGHGGVGTLLYCHAAGLPIDRRHDQPGAGHYFTIDGVTGRPENHWTPIDSPSYRRPS